MHRDSTPLDPSRETPPETSAEAVRRACIDAALAAWEDAGVQGLCAEGRWEVAVSAMRRLDLRAVVGGRRIPPAEQGTLDAPEGP
jgi:hypothetical protein